MSKLFYDLDQINPKLKILSDNYEIIKKEFIKNKNKLTWTNWNSNNEYTSITDNPYNGWKVAALSCQYDYSMLKKPSEYSKIFNTNIHFDHDNELMYTDNAFILPKLFNFIKEVGIKCRVGISALEPEKHIQWHVDPDPVVDDSIIIRGLWGLDVNSNKDEYCYLSVNNNGTLETEHFVNNKFILFFGRSQHMVYNTLKTPRYCLCFDTRKTISDLL